MFDNRLIMIYKKELSFLIFQLFHNITDLLSWMISSKYFLIFIVWPFHDFHKRTLIFSLFDHSMISSKKIHISSVWPFHDFQLCRLPAADQAPVCFPSKKVIAAIRVSSTITISSCYSRVFWSILSPLLPFLHPSLMIILQ